MEMGLLTFVPLDTVDLVSFRIIVTHQLNRIPWKDIKYILRRKDCIVIYYIIISPGDNYVEMVGGCAQCPDLLVNESKKTGACSARARSMDEAH